MIKKITTIQHGIGLNLTKECKGMNIIKGDYVKVYIEKIPDEGITELLNDNNNNKKQPNKNITKITKDNKVIKENKKITVIKDGEKTTKLLNDNLELTEEEREIQEEMNGTI